jgi:hypothetical protein
MLFATQQKKAKKKLLRRMKATHRKLNFSSTLAFRKKPGEERNARAKREFKAKVSHVPG